MIEHHPRDGESVTNTRESGVPERSSKGREHDLVAHLYEIRVRGTFDQSWSDWFGGLDVRPQDSGETLIVGPVLDQAALHGILDRAFDVGLVLLSVRRLEGQQ